MAPMQSAQPVSTYGDALSWLFTHTRVEDWLFDASDADPLPDAARLVAAMFWVNEADLCRDLRRIWNQTLAPATNAPFRRSYRAGWR